MNVGESNRRKTILAVVLLAAAVPLFIYTVAYRPAPASSAGEPQPGQARLVTQMRHQRTGATQLLKPSLDPTLRLGLLKASEEIEYKGTGRNIFSAQQEVAENPAGPIPKPLDCAFRDKNNPKCAPPPAAGPPPIPLKFYGFATERGQPKKIFLAEGDDVFIAGVGDIVNRRYRVVQIGPTSVTIEDMLSNNRQTIPLSG